MDHKITILTIAKIQNGFITSEDIRDRNLCRMSLTRLVSTGDLVRISRGVYRISEAMDDELYAVQQRFSRGIFSGMTALSLSGITDWIPKRISMTFPAAYNISSAKQSGIQCCRARESVYSLGVTEYKTGLGNSVRGYCLERVLCDLAKDSSAADPETFLEALRSYVRSDARELVKLKTYARLLGVSQRMNMYLEVLVR